MKIALESAGPQPRFRYDIVLPLVQGRVQIDGATLDEARLGQRAEPLTDPRFRDGDFHLVDANLAHHVIPSIDAGWGMVCLPVVVKRQAVLSYFWVRADRGIDSPKDLEGKTICTLESLDWSIVGVYAKGLLQRDYDVDFSTVRWEFAHTGGRSGPDEGKPHWQRLLDGEVDACIGNIREVEAWRLLEGSPDKVKRLFPDYRERQRDLVKTGEGYPPSHIIVMGRKLDEAQPDLARRVYDAFERSREMAYAEALADGTSYSLLMGHREAVRDQLRDMGDVHKHGMTANKRAFETLLGFYFDLGLTKRSLTLEDVFAASTLDT